MANKGEGRPSKHDLASLILQRRARPAWRWRRAENALRGLSLLGKGGCAQLCRVPEGAGSGTQWDWLWAVLAFTSCGTLSGLLFLSDYVLLVTRAHHLCLSLLSCWEKCAP